MGPNSGWGTGRRYGYFTLKLAKRVGPSGKVCANDIVGDFLAEIRDRAEELKLSNIETVLGTTSDPRLPANQLDMVFVVRSPHDMDMPVEVLDSIAAGLKPGAGSRWNGLTGAFPTPGPSSSFWRSGETRRSAPSPCFSGS